MDILATPEYHGSFSGALKDALDLMGFEGFEGKMGLIGVSVEKLRAFDALNSLRTVGRPACVGRSEAGVSSGGMEDVRQRRTFKTPEIARRLQEIGEQVTRFASFTSARPPMKSWRRDTRRIWTTSFLC
jgi:NAD(P)H-dependent FMN reductase